MIPKLDSGARRRGLIGPEPLAASAHGGAVRLPLPPSRARTWVAERQGWLGLAGLLTTGLVISTSAAQTDLLLPQTVSGGVGVTGLGGVFGQHAINLHLGGVIVVLGLMFVSYAMAVTASRQLSARAVLVAIAVLHALVLLAPPLISTDVFSYIAYGKIGAVYHGNPYVQGPSAIQLDPLYQYIGAQWVHTPSDYGPLFTALSYVLAPLTIAGNVVAYKAIAALSSLVVVWVVWNAARLRGLDPVKAVALVGLNPVMVVYGVGGGHNDMLMLAILLTSVYVLLLRRERTSGALIVAATAVKLTAGLLLPFVVAQRSARSSVRSPRAVLSGVILAALAAAALSFGLFGFGPLHLLTTIASVQSQGGIHSIPGLLLGMFDLRLDGAVGLTLELAFAAWLTWLVVRVWLSELDWITGAGWATVALLVTAGLLLPWYIGWLVPLAALSTDTRLRMTAFVLTGVGLTTL